MRFRLPFKGLLPPAGVLTPFSTEKKQQAYRQTYEIALRLSQNDAVIEHWSSNNLDALLEICNEEWKLLDFYTLVTSGGIFSMLQTILRQQNKPT